MFQQPFLIQTVYQIVIAAVKSFFPPKKHVKTPALPFVPGLFVPLAKPFDPLLPGQAPGYGGIPVIKMIGNDHAGIAQFLIVPYIFRAF
jgi:hypothetical protein